MAKKKSKQAIKEKKATKRIYWIIAAVVIVIAAAALGYWWWSGSNSTKVATPSPTPNQGGTAMQWSSPPAMAIDTNKQYSATITTNYGVIKVDLFAKDDPVTVNNFVFLARQGFYNGVKFHRVVKGFMIQTGDRTGTGGGTPGYRIPDEKVTRNYLAGILAMANTGQPNSGGSQFFINLMDNTDVLSKTYTIFGMVTNGFSVVQKIGDVPVTANVMGELSVPTVDVHIENITIEEK
jgi:cyclophilin family peptidyl-prolyl cis-trans isomerase